MSGLGFGGGAMALPGVGQTDTGGGYGLGSMPDGYDAGFGRGSLTQAGGSGISQGQNPYAGAAPNTQSGVAGLTPTSQQLGGMQPLPYQDFGAVPFINAAQTQAAQVSPGSVGGYISSLMPTLMAAMAPQYQLASQGVDQDMAARGIFNSGTANQAQGQLQSQLFSALLGQASNMGQQDVLQNAGYQQQGNLANQAASNQANAANAGAYGNVVQGNQAQYNAYLQQMLQSGTGMGQSLLGSYLGSYGTSPQAMGILGKGAGYAGSAYDGAYGAGMQNAGAFSNALSNAFANSNSGVGNTPSFGAGGLGYGSGYGFSNSTGDSLTGQPSGGI